MGRLHRNRDFTKLWAGETVSVFGSIVSGTAIPFTAVLALNAGPAQMAALRAADLLPAFLASLFAGVWVDRLRRRPVLIGADLGRAALLLTIPAAALMGRLHVEHLYAVAFLAAILTVLFDVAYQSYLPSLVSREELSEGNSKLTASAAVAEVGAFSLGGWLLQAFSGPIAVLIDSASFLVSAACVGAIRRPEPPPDAEDRHGMGREIADGLRLIAREPILRALGTVKVLLGFSYALFGTLILLYTARVLGFSPGVLGMIFAVGGLGSLGGAALTGRVTRRFGAGRAMVGGLAFSGLGAALIPLAPGATLLGAIFLIGQQAINDPAATIYEITEVTVRQSITPDRFLGRMNAGIRFAGVGATLAGTLAAGFLGDRIGMRNTLFLGAAGILLAAVLLALSPAGRLRDVPSLEAVR